MSLQRAARRPNSPAAFKGAGGRSLGSNGAQRFDIPVVFLALFASQTAVLATAGEGPVPTPYTRRTAPPSTGIDAPLI